VSAGTPGHGRRRNRRFTPRANARVAASPPPRPTSTAASGSTSRLTLAAILLGGVLLGMFAQALPVGARRPIEFGVVIAFALAAALAYRRWVRSLIEERRRRERSA
jgi:predicted lipid-binding transport protein (Tim44 family)